ncbi:unnamed protein product [Closterium sp. NIES-54]
MVIAYMAARIASKSRSKIATPALDRSPQRGISAASGNCWRHASVRRRKQRWALDQSPHRADTASTTHGAAEGWRRRENAAAAAAAAGADRLQCRSAAKLHSDHLRHPRLRLHRRHLRHLRYHRHRCRHPRLHCRH